MKRFCVLAVSVLLLAAAPSQVDVDRHYAEGQRLFGTGDFAGALEQFKRVDRLAPNDPQVNSWIGATLNELGQHAEAKTRVEAAINKLRGMPGPIDVTYFTLLSRIQMNLGEYDQAIQTLGSFTFLDDGSPEAAKTKAALDTQRAAVKTRLVGLGVDCLRSGDLACARTRLTQADVANPAKPAVREWLARDSLLRADKAPATSEEEKAKKAESHELAIRAARLWVEEAGPDAREAQRQLAKALLAAKTKEGYEEALGLLTSLKQSAGQAPDRAIESDLAAAHAGLKQWEAAVASASAVIALEPDDPVGQGYCLRSFAYAQMGRCEEALSDGKRCRNADGTPRQLRHLESCEQRLKQAKRAADTAEGNAAKTERNCEHLLSRIRWARSSDVALDDMVALVTELKSSEAGCKAHFDAQERPAEGSVSYLAELCAVGSRTAGSPVNLSQRSKTELTALQAKTQEFLSLCGRYLNASQKAAVDGGLSKIERALQ